ncbi:L,D-transpeptidase Cds6 family protein [Variovorax boronicumulans]|uniref:L,D-transpeptidase Cds6 family protein n=1 Tax=Variovorax boronicumulans TaxID=436515 RepID=UPI00085C7220|nr:hypothetical protein [Variovorax boronicumulans]OEZ29236.1 hypothetical protein AO062_17730 [Variovorax boronicumulans]
MHRIVAQGSSLVAAGLLATAGIAATPAAAPVAAVAPAAAPANPTNPVTHLAEVETAVRAWAAAWSARDVERYLAAYASDFTPARGQTRERWEADRRARITGKSRISVGIEGLVISVQGTSASAQFRQVYSADALTETDRKTLELQRVGPRWLIRKESAGN